jgi:hypothetical protein
VIFVCVLRLGMVTEMRAIPDHYIGLFNALAADVSGKAIIVRGTLLAMFVFRRMVKHHKEISRSKGIGNAIIRAGDDVIAPRRIYIHHSPATAGRRVLHARDFSVLDVPTGTKTSIRMVVLYSSTVSFNAPT